MNQISQQLDALYCESYAHWAPLMRARWNKESSEAAMKYVADDIMATLALHERGPYVGKLYAELDALRDAALAKRQVRLRKRNPYR